METLPTTSPWKLIAAILGLATTALAGADVPAVSPQEAARLVSDGKALLVDVREPAEWAASGVAAPALLLAKSDFDGAKKLWAPFLESVGDRKVIVYCRSGRRSGVVAAALSKSGFDVANAGGFSAWQSADLPVRAASEPPAKP